MVPRFVSKEKNKPHSNFKTFFFVEGMSGKCRLNVGDPRKNTTREFRENVGPTKLKVKKTPVTRGSSLVFFFGFPQLQNIKNILCRSWKVLPMPKQIINVGKERRQKRDQREREREDVYHADVAKMHPRGNHLMLALIVKTRLPDAFGCEKKNCQTSGFRIPKTTQ